MDTVWEKYYKITQNRPPSSLLVKALSFVKKKEIALDLGSGALKDSKYLLSQGFKQVIAVDKEAIPQELLNELPKERFQFIQTNFDRFDFPQKTFDLVNAQFALPFNPRSSFLGVWKRLTSSLIPGGVLVGQLFGIGDEWNTPESKMIFHTKTQVQQLLAGLDVVELTEEEKDGKLADGSPKHWHLFHIIAKNSSRADASEIDPGASTGTSERRVPSLDQGSLP